MKMKMTLQDCNAFCNLVETQQETEVVWGYQGLAVCATKTVIKGSLKCDTCGYEWVYEITPTKEPTASLSVMPSERSASELDGAVKTQWERIGYKSWALVNHKGKILASVGRLLDGTWYASVSEEPLGNYMSEEWAKLAVIEKLKLETTNVQ